MAKQRPAPHPHPAPHPAPGGGVRHPTGNGFQPSTGSAAGSQLGGGPGLIPPGYEQPGGSNAFALDLMRQGDGTELA